MIWRPVRRFLKQAIVRSNDALAVAALLMHGRRPKSGLTILCYHRIADGVPRYPPYDPYNVSPDTFASQLRTLAGLRRQRIISATQLARLIDDGHVSRPPKAAVLLTFDDGYQSFLPAARAMRLHGIPSVLFASTHYLGSRVFDFCSFDRWYSKVPGADAAVYTPLTFEDCLQLRPLGVEVQSHSHSHRPLGSLQDPIEVRREIEDSRRVIEALGNRSFAFAYPYGSRLLRDYTPDSERHLKDAGLTFAVSTDAGFNPWPSLPACAFMLKRIPINDTDRGIVFEAKASGYSGCLSALKFVAHHAQNAYVALRERFGQLARPKLS
jgi:peptidoglycan/xylan/chitin deacetylase (PgdA/CDA1 family)